MAASSRHRSSHGRGGSGLVASVGGVVLVVVIAVLSAWANHALSIVQPASPHAVAAQPAMNPPLAPLPMGAQVRAWFTDAKPSIIAAFGAADNLVTAAKYSDIATTGAACHTTAGAVANLQKHLPSPDPTLNTELQLAITSYQAGIRHCVSGTQNRDPIEIGEAAFKIERGSSYLNATVGIIEDDLSADARDNRVWTA